MKQSASLKKPVYTAFNSAALNDIYAALPTTKVELIDMKGIGQNKLKYLVTI